MSWFGNVHVHKWAFLRIEHDPRLRGNWCSSDAFTGPRIYDVFFCEGCLNYEHRNYRIAPDTKKKGSTKE